MIPVGQEAEFRQEGVIKADFDFPAQV